MKRWLFSCLLATIGLSLTVVVWRSAAADRQARAEASRDSTPVASGADALARAVVPEDEFDFGVIDVGEAGEHSFVVRNEGQADLVLQPGSSSCRCTLIDLPQGIIPAGGEGRVRLEWLAPESNERFRHGATVLTNDPQRPRLLFVVSGRVRRHLVMVPPDVVVFSSVLPGQQRSNRALLYSQAYEAFDLGEIESTHPYITWEIQAMDEATLGRLDARSGYEIRIRLDSTEQLGRYGGHLMLRPHVPGLADDEQPPPRQLNVFSDVVGLVRVSGPDLDGRFLPIGLLTQGEGARKTVFVSVAGEERELNVSKIETTPKFLKVSVAQEGEATGTLTRYRVDIEVPPDTAPCNYMRPGIGEVRIATDHPDLPELVLQVEFAVVPAEWALRALDRISGNETMLAHHYVRRGAWILAALLLLPSFSGCGGCSKPPLPDPRVTEEEEEFVAPGSVPPAAATTPAETPSADAGGATNPAPAARTAAGAPCAAARKLRPLTPDEEFVDPATVAAVQVAQSKRPRDLTAWTPEDFLAARPENDVQLADAVAVLGQRSVGDGAAAALLIQLLQMSVAGADADPEAQQFDLSDDADLGRALIAALGATRTAIGRELIKQVLRGKAKTSFDDFALTSAAIQALADYPSPENEDILYVLLTRPEQVRPAATGTGVTAEALRDQCLSVMGSRSSSIIRLRLARHVVASDTPPQEMAELLPLLVEPRLENLSAQVVLYGSDRIGDDSKFRVQTSFWTYSSAALDRLLGVPPDASMFDGDILDRRLFTHADALAAAEALWGGTFAGAMALRVQGLKDVDEQRDFLRLACNVPSPAVRSRLLAALEQRWLESSEGFSSGRVEVQQIRDPGFLLVVKALPREDDPAKRRLDEEDEDDREQPAGDNPARSQALERIKKERAARYAWMDVGERFVRELNSRFHAAALAEKERALGQRGAVTVQVPGADEADIDPFAPQADTAAEPVEPSAGSDASQASPLQLPIALHPGAKVAVEYHRRWPADLATGGRSPPVTFLEVHYVRMEVDDRMGKLVGFYNRQLGRAGDHFVDCGRWLEDVVRDAETGRARSIDVLISRQVDEAAVSRDVAERLIVEVLVVEAPDPTRAASDADDDLAAEQSPAASRRGVP